MNLTQQLDTMEKMVYVVMKTKFRIGKYSMFLTEFGGLIRRRKKKKKIK
jgi:hypothetical protein